MTTNEFTEALDAKQKTRHLYDAAKATADHLQAMMDLFIQRNILDTDPVYEASLRGGLEAARRTLALATDADVAAFERFQAAAKGTDYDYQANEGHADTEPPLSGEEMDEIGW
jgi:hypothetical protein